MGINQLRGHTMTDIRIWTSWCSYKQGLRELRNKIDRWKWNNKKKKQSENEMRAILGDDYTRAYSIPGLY